MSDNKSSSGGTKIIDAITLQLVRLFDFLGGAAQIGFRNFQFGIEALLIVLSVVIVFFSITFANYKHLQFLHWVWPSLFSVGAISFLRTFPRLWHFVALNMIAFCILFFVCVARGFIPFRRNAKFQERLEDVGLKNAKGLEPKVMNVIAVDENKTKLLITARGIGLDRFETRRSDLEASFQQIIEAIRVSKDRKTVEILLCQKELTKYVSFQDIVEYLKKPYHFVVGETAFGFIVQDLRELPHLLIAGSTGGGKSAFFRQLFLSLLRFSSHIQVYLIDLKLGVEVKEFGDLPNVRIAKNEQEAVQVLGAIKIEMYKRFKFMEELGVKKIEPTIHKRDLIVVGIDEASVLYGKTSVSKSKSAMVAKARDLTDELAKLARAAGIHLVIATQKAIKESLDTKTLENLPGRMIFKMSTHAGSNTALGNVRAYSLPDIKGRAIWAGGNKFIEVQAPYLSEKEAEEECKALAEKLKEEKDWNFQPMLDCKSTIDNAKAALNSSDNLESVA